MDVQIDILYPTLPDDKKHDTKHHIVALTQNDFPTTVLYKIYQVIKLGIYSSKHNNYVDLPCYSHLFNLF